MRLAKGPHIQPDRLACLSAAAHARTHARSPPQAQPCAPHLLVVATTTRHLLLSAPPLPRARRQVHTPRRACEPSAFEPQAWARRRPPPPRAAGQSTSTAAACCVLLHHQRRLSARRRAVIARRAENSQQPQPRARRLSAVFRPVTQPANFAQLAQRFSEISWPRLSHPSLERRSPGPAAAACSTRFCLLPSSLPSPPSAPPRRRRPSSLPPSRRKRTQRLVDAAVSRPAAVTTSPPPSSLPVPSAAGGAT